MIVNNEVFAVRDALTTIVDELSDVAESLDLDTADVVLLVIKAKRIAREIQDAIDANQIADARLYDEREQARVDGEAA